MIKKILITVLICAVIGAVVGLYLWNKPHVKVEDEKGIQVTAMALCKAFNDDKAAASNTYLNKAIDVTGEVSDVIINQDGGKMVVLKTDDPILAVQCTLREKDEMVEKGKTVTIKGFYSDFSDITGVLLTGCVIIKE